MGETKKKGATPEDLMIVGVTIALVGAILGALAAQWTTTAGIITGSVFGAFASLVLSVGLIAKGVQIGMRG